MTAPLFRVGEECRISHSPAYPELSGRDCTVTGTLALRPNYDGQGNYHGMSLAYKINVNGTPMCAPERLLAKKFEHSDWGMLRGIWQPEGLKSARRPQWKVWK
jgi:hypothetical protein